MGGRLKMKHHTRWNRSFRLEKYDQVWVDEAAMHRSMGVVSIFLGQFVVSSASVTPVVNHPR